MPEQGSEMQREPEKKLWKSAWHWSLLVFLLPWSAVTLCMDNSLAFSTLHQFQAVSFPTVQGEVLKCQVTEKQDEGILYNVDIEYAYEVENQRFTSNHIRALKAWGKGPASRFVAAHPPNSHILVYYDPADPTRALLIPGVGGPELYMLMVALHFNLGMIGLGYAFASCRTGWLFVGEDGNLHERFRPRTIEHGNVIRIRLPSVSPALVTLLFLTFGPILVVIAVPYCAGMSPSVTVMLVAWAIVLGSAALLYLFMALPIAHGKADLVIDHGEKTLTLPRTCGRRELVVVPIADVMAIDVVCVKKKGDEGTKCCYVTTLHWRAASGETCAGPLAEWYDVQPAEALAAWVRATAGISAQVPI